MLRNEKLKKKKRFWHQVKPLVRQAAVVVWGFSRGFQGLS